MRRIQWAIVPLVLATALSASSAVVAQTVTFTLGAPDGINDLGPQAALHWRDLMSERSGSELQMDVLADGVLGSDQQIFEQMRTDEVQLHVGGPTIIHNLVREYQCMEAEYVFPNEEHGYRVWLGEPGEQVNRDLEAQFGLTILGVAKAGAREVTSNRPINSVADFAGLKIRVTNKLRSAVFEAFGALPVPLPITEVYGALRQGAIDAQENPLSTIYGNRFFEAQDYVLLTNHIWKYWVFTASKDFVDSLSPEHLQIFEDTLAETIAWTNEERFRKEDEVRKLLEEAGIKFIQPDVATLMEIAAPVVRKFADENCRPGLLETIATYAIP